MNKLILFTIVFIASNLFGSISASTFYSGNEALGTNNYAVHDSPDNQPIDSIACERFIDNYEQFVNQLIPLLLKLMEGDQSASVQYSSLLTENMQTMDSIQIYFPLFNEAQVARYEEIGKTYSNAMQKVANPNANENAEESEVVVEQEEEAIQPTNFGCDRVIDEYEKLMDQYVLFNKKLLDAPDTVDMDELTSLNKKAQALSLEMANCNFSEEEVLRLQKIGERVVYDIQSSAK